MNSITLKTLPPDSNPAIFLAASFFSATLSTLMVYSFDFREGFEAKFFRYTLKKGPTMDEVNTFLILFNKIISVVEEF